MTAGMRTVSLVIVLIDVPPLNWHVRKSNPSHRPLSHTMAMALDMEISTTYKTNTHKKNAQSTHTHTQKAHT